MVKADFHIHTRFCDGKATPEEMVLAAVQQGLDAIGFSGHSFVPFDPQFCIADQDGYINEIKRLQEKYKNIEIFLGIENDACSEIDVSAFEYLIGSVHYIKKDGKYYQIDVSADGFASLLSKYGDPYKLCNDYFESVATMKQKYTFIGHFDLISKFNENGEFFDVEDKRYVNAALEAVHAHKNELFEMNSGAVSRGVRKTIYPSMRILREIKAVGGEIILSSDAHAPKNIAFMFPIMAELAKESGFSYATVLKKGGVRDYIKL